MSAKLEMMKCQHRGCGHEWIPRVKRPVKCPQCQSPLWKSEFPKQKKAPTPKVVEVEQTPIEVSEEAAPTPPTIDTPMPEPQSVASGVVEPENPVLRLQREAEERLRRLANDPVD